MGDTPLFEIIVAKLKEFGEHGHIGKTRLRFGVHRVIGRSGGRTRSPIDAGAYRQSAHAIPLLSFTSFSSLVVGKGIRREHGCKGTEALLKNFHFSFIFIIVICLTEGERTK
jgi:hypothetical protein